VPDPDAGTRLKTKHSRRTVPIHPELIRISLLDCATRQHEVCHDRPSPELQTDRRGSYSGDLRRWANRWLDRAGAKGDRESFHSLRHNPTDALRRAGATGEVIDGLLGWSRGNMRDR
jgi:integrase